jgi:hypothetical protein
VMTHTESGDIAPLIHNRDIGWSLVGGKSKKCKIHPMTSHEGSEGE